MYYVLCEVHEHPRKLLWKRRNFFKACALHTGFLLGRTILYRRAVHLNASSKNKNLMYYVIY